MTLLPNETHHIVLRGDLRRLAVGRLGVRGPPVRVVIGTAPA